MRNLATASGKAASTTCSFLMVFSISCGTPRPDIADIEEYIGAGLPGFLRVQDVECEFFPSKQETGEGRASCRGRLELMEDLFEPTPPNTIISAVAARGPTRYQAQRLLESYPLHVVQRTVRQGTAADFRAELRYQKLVDGWELHGSPLSQRFNGSARGQLREPVLIVGEPRWNEYLTSLATHHERLKRRSQELQKEIDKLLTPAVNLSGVHSAFLDRELEYTLVPTASPKWHEVDTYGKAYEKTFETLGKLQWRETPIARGCGYSAPAPEETVSLSGRIIIEDIEGEEPFRAELIVAFERDNGFTYCTSPSMWDGEKFVRGEGRGGDTLFKDASSSNS